MGELSGQNIGIIFLNLLVITFFNMGLPNFVQWQ